MNRQSISSQQNMLDKSRSALTRLGCLVSINNQQQVNTANIQDSHVPKIHA